MVLVASLVLTLMSAIEQSPRGAFPAAPIQYTLRFPAPQTHYVEVEAIVPTGNRREMELMMAVWTPGSYLVREFPRHVEAVRAHTASGEPVAVQKSRKNRWRIAAGGAGSVTVTYRVYARELTVRTNFVDAEFALLNGAATFLAVADELARPYEVRLELPPGWQRTVTALDRVNGSDAHHYRAPDYDTLVDAPILAGNPVLHEFAVDGTPHVLANVGDGGLWDGPRSVRDLQAIVGAHRQLWGRLPYRRYVFFNLFSEAGGGGIEHADSTVLMASRWRTRTRAGYLAWLNLASHELFHAWNVKRLRPAELGPFDYERENHTANLWVAEGFTEYYGDLLVRRAGLSSEREYLDVLSSNIEQLQAAPGRLVVPVASASFDAWIKYYRPDENSPNATVSYYTKGGLIAFLLDLEIRRRTAGARSLDDVMRLAYERFSDARGYTTAEFRQVAGEVAGADLGSWFEAAADREGELDYAPALALVGLRFRDDAASPGQTPRVWLGVSTRNDGGRLLVSQVRRNTPAADAGVNVDDELLAIDDYRVRWDQWNARMEAYRPGDRVSLLVARRDKLVRLDVTFGSEPPKSWRLDVDLSATPEQRQHRRAWLGEQAAASPADL